MKCDGRIFVVNQTIFENLNQIVEYYSTREFVRGVCLKYPVGEKTVTDFTGSWLSSVRAPGCYMELKDIDKEVMDWFYLLKRRIFSYLSFFWLI